MPPLNACVRANFVPHVCPGAACRLRCVDAAAASAAAPSPTDTAAAPEIDAVSLDHDLPGTLETVLPTFEELGVDERLTVMLPELGIEHPSEIQERAIPRIASGQSLAIQSFTGSGKTLAFMLPVMTAAVKRLEQRTYSRADRDDFGPDALIVAPSRELAMQTVRVAQSLLPQEAWPLIQNAIGGANMRRQVDSIKVNKPLIVVGTPGRMAELSRLGLLRTHRTAAVVLDEVDQLLCQQFRDDLLRILSHTGSRLPKGPQIISASATMTSELVTKLKALVRSTEDIPIIAPFDATVPLSGADSDPDAERAASNGDASTSSAAPPAWGWGQDSGFWAGRGGAASNRGTAGGIEQGRVSGTLPPQLEHAVLHEVKRHHVDAVRRVVHALDAQRVLVFMNHQDRLRDAMHKLAARGLSVGVLHGEMKKQARGAVLAGFRAGRFRILLVSDVVARGLDVADCDAVIHLELPSNAAHYAHRAGRTGRMGRPGAVISVADKSSVFVVDKIAAELDMPIRQAKVSAGRITVIADGKVQVLGRYVEKAREAQTEDDELPKDATTPL